VVTEEELGAIKEMHPSAFSIWIDQMFEERTVAQHVEDLLFYMPAGVLMTFIMEIEKQRALSLAEERGEEDVC
jgi:hypothetical protein